MRPIEIIRHNRAKYPDMPTLKLARIVYKNNNLHFKSVEDVRSKLRYVEGKHGNKQRKSIPSCDVMGNRPLNPYKLPASEETIYKPFVFSGHKRIAIFSDIHVPYHSISALTAAIDFAKKEKPDALLLNGDILDCHRLSRFIKDPKKRDFKGELDVFKELFNVLEKNLSCKIYLKIGNHEERYQHFLFEKAHELVGVEEFELSNIIKARAKGIEVISDKRYMMFNDLTGIHGHEYVTGVIPSVNPARALFLKAKVSSFQGHNHQTSEHPEPTLTGKTITAWSTGCLSELHPAYMPLNKWNHGFAMLDLDSNGKDYEFRNKRIYNGKTL